MALEEDDIPAPLADLPLRRRLSQAIVRLGPWRVTLLMTLASALCSLGLTWLILHLSGSTDMGSARWISLLVPVPLALMFGGTTIHLVAALEKARQRIQQLALADPLTGLGNRRHFLPAARRELELARRHSQPLALVLLDIDHFKQVNDTYGHNTGDQALLEVGQRCQRALRATDLLARWGGEEFIMLLPNTNAQQATQLAERVRQAVSSTPLVLLQEEPVQMTVSIGVVGMPVGRSATLDMLVRFADEALYTSKNGGRDKVTTAVPQPVEGPRIPATPQQEPGSPPLKRRAASPAATGPWQP